jgi:hypothetical protein
MTITYKRPSNTGRATHNPLAGFENGPSSILVVPVADYPEKVGEGILVHMHGGYRHDFLAGLSITLTPEQARGLLAQLEGLNARGTF